MSSEAHTPDTKGSEKHGEQWSSIEETYGDNKSGRPECFKSTIQEVLFVFVATMAIAAQAWATGSITVVSAYIGTDLDMTNAEITWLTASSSLTGGAFLLFFGRVADLFGRKSMIVVSFFLFAILSLACGFANTAITLDALNGLLGILSASSVPPAIGILGNIYKQPGPRKNAAFASFSAGNPVGYVMGMIFGGIATQLFGWRASYWLLAIVFGALTVVAFFCVPVDTTPKRAWNWQTMKEMDPLGTLLTIAGIGMFSAALSLGDTAPHGWRTGYVLSLLIIGLILIIAFVFWELYYPYPLVPMSIWKDTNFSLLMGMLSLGFMAFPPAAFFISLFFQRVWHFAAIETAVHLLPMAITGIIVNIIAGLILHKVSNKLLMFIGAAAYFVSFLLLALNKQSSSYWAFCFPALLFNVVGADLEFNVANMYVMSSLPKEQASVAGSLFQTITRLSSTIGFGIATAVFNAVSANPSMGAYYRGEPQTQPYAATFYFTVACAALSLLLVPWMTLGTQGQIDITKQDETEVEIDQSKIE